MQQLPVQALIKQPVAPHQLLLLRMQPLVATGQVVPEHLLRIEILLMQLILLQHLKLEQQLHSHGMFLIPMAPVLVRQQLIK